MDHLGPGSPHACNYLRIKPSPSARRRTVECCCRRRRRNPPPLQLHGRVVGSVQSQPWLTALNLRLSDDIGDVGDVLIRVVHNSRSSNRVRIAIGHAGGGLPNDPGSEPTPAPPYPISGHVTAYGVGLANITVTFTGPASGTTTTDAQGNYSILAPEPGNYVTPLHD